MIRNIFILAIIFATFVSNAYSQCDITAYANAGTTTVEVCLGDAVTLTATGGCPNYVLNNDFNDGTVGTGWSSTNQAMFTNPCSPYSPDGTIFLWMGSTSTAPRYLVTNNFDVSMGGSIEFEMRYSVQSASSPCEGPDEYDEGIAIQYSTNNGATWVTIEYYAPNGDVLNYIPTASTPGASGQTPFTVWVTQTVPIPVGAQTISTKFRWAQTASTSELYDHWGLDNVAILVPPPTIEVWWDHGPTGYNPPDVTPTTTTTYTVHLTDGTDTVASSVEVIVNPIPTSDFTVTSPVCVGNPATATYTGSGSANATYSWNFDGAQPGTADTQGPHSIFWDTPGTKNVTLSLIENNCLSPETIVSVVVNPKPAAPGITFDPPCENSNIDLYADTISGATYNWVGPNGYTSTQQNPSIPGASSTLAGTYSVAITDTNGCVSDLTSQVVTILPVPIVSFSGTPTSGCEPLTVNFTNNTSGTSSLYWEFGDGAVDTSSTPTHTYNQDGSYNVSLTITDNTGCSAFLTLNSMITVHPIPVANFTNNPEVGAPGGMMDFNSSYTQSLATWYWDFGDGSTENLQVPTTQHAFSEMGAYTVIHIVESPFGCKDTVEKTILVINLTIPNVFTPNGDGYNDTFVIDGIEQLTETQLIVFNRWGKKVFESMDYQNDWDGENSSDGVYYFILNFRNDVFKPINGTVTILNKTK